MTVRECPGLLEGSESDQNYVVALGLSGFENSADAFLQPGGDPARQGRHDYVHLGIGEFGITEDVTRPFLLLGEDISEPLLGFCCRTRSRSKG